MNWIKVFKAGTHRDSAGNEESWPVTRLETMASTYNDQPETSLHVAPMVIGHPKTDAPAYGWIDKLRVVDDHLEALPKMVQPEFEEWVAKGLYRTKSIAVGAGDMLKHIGWLGAAPPAIKGLPFNYQFEGAPADERIIEFAEPVTDPSLNTDTNTMDPAIEKLTGDIATMEGQITEILALLKKDEAEDKAEDANAPETEVAPGGKAPQFAELEGKVITLVSKNTTMAAELESVKTQFREKEFNEYLASPDIIVRVTPAMRADVLADMRDLDSLAVGRQYAEGEERPLDRYKRTLQALPVAIQFSEHATGSKASPEVKNFNSGFALEKGADFDEGRRTVLMLAEAKAKADGKNFKEHASEYITLAYNALNNG